MSKILLLVVLLFSATLFSVGPHASFSLAPLAHAAVNAGENLLLNGAFDAEQVDFPGFWNPSSVQNVIYHRTGGPGGRKPAIVLLGDGSVPGSVSVRQQGLALVPGETYRLSAWIKTKGLKSRGYGLIIHNSGWTAALGITALPADSDWTFKEKTFKLMPSKGNEYGVAMYAAGLTGELLFADVRLEAVSEGARKGSSSQLALIAAPKLVPIEPLLCRIPRSNPTLTFRLFGQLPDKPAAYECLFTVGGKPLAPPATPLPDGRVTADLAGFAAGDAAIAAVLRHRGSGEVVFKASWPIAIIDLPAIDLTSVRRLNTLVAELLNQPVSASAAPQSFSFVNPREGWVFVALETATPAPGLGVSIDGRAPVITAATARREAFHELPAGPHRITVAAASGAARLVVRSIPEIFDYPPCLDSVVRENGHYDWAFMQRHILPAVTTLNGGQLPAPALDEAKALGLKWLANFGATSAEAPEKLRARMEKTPGMTQPQYDGFTSDELFFGRNTIDNYTKALWSLPNPSNRLIYTWVVGKPAIPALHADFISACLNASRGRGRMLFEAYCHPQADEKAAAAYLDDMLGETMRRFNAYFPNAAAGTGMIFGNFNQLPVISLESDPAVDFKYFLDMQVNRVATHPEFANLATVGYWGTYYGDEELVRWSFKLMRHYAVEGRRELLSTRYGFTYNPGLVTNPDFADGLQGWNAQPAAAGSIRAHVIPGYGKDVQRRWGAGSAGDSVCVMTRQPGAPNRLSQTARGLTVGKAYCLQFVTADLQDLTGQRYNPRQYGIDLDQGAMEVLAERSFVHVDRRTEHRGVPSEHLGKINLHRIVFRAKSPSLALTFSDAKARPGEQLVLNFVQLKPYLESAEFLVHYASHS